MLSARGQKKLDRIVEIQTEIEELELELQKILDPQEEEEEDEEEPEPVKAKAKKGGKSPCAECGSKIKRHKKTCSKFGAPADAPTEEAATESASPAMKRDPLTDEQFKEVKHLFHEERKMASEIARITGYPAEEINVAVQQNKYGMYIFARKRK